MDGSHVGRVWHTIERCAREDRSPVAVHHACLAGVRLLSADGAGLMFAHSRAAADLEPLFATDDRTEILEELQVTLGEGPAVTALERYGPLFVHDVTRADRATAWPMFVRAAAEHGVRGVYALPLCCGTARVGSLSFYWTRAVRPTGRGLGEAVACAEAALTLTLDRRSGATAGIAELIDAAFEGHRAVVHQAVGMVAVQLNTGMAEALARLRAYAFSSNQRLSDVASDVVKRDLVFVPDSLPPPGEGPFS